VDATPAPNAAERRDPLHAFAELALITVNADPPGQTLRRVAELAKQSLAGVQDVSLTVIEDGRPRSVVFTGPLAIDLDERQYELGFGPCLDAAKTGETIIVDTGSDDPPYREFARTAARAGVQHAVSVGLPIAQHSIGGLNIYKTLPGGFPVGFLEHAEAFAGYAAVAVNNVTSYAGAVNEATHLRIAMESRAVIEQAKGMVMARNRCNADEAFAMLRRISQHRNVKLHQVAQAIVDASQK
jgi:GAF domain-containing protein